MIDLTYLKQLPLQYKMTIPDDYLDAMGHMNVRYYLAMFDEAAWPLFASFGMTRAYNEKSRGGAFALEHHVRYLAEVHAGETVAIHSRILGRTPKRVHFIHFMINETTQKLAATLEVVGAHADLDQRRMSPFPPHVAANIDALLGEHEQLPWPAPICGVMRP